MRNLWRKNSGIGGVAFAAALTLGFASPGHAQSSDYLDYNGLTREVQSLVGGSNLARVMSVATTAGGRDVWMVELGNPNGVPLDQRPAVMVVANLSADHLIGSYLAVEAIRRLLAQAATDDEVRRVLNENTIYVFPRANPDGAEAFFGSLLSDRRGNARPYDDDNDGRTDEDGPNDLNGDGMITVMRVMDPEGDFIVHPDDERLMKRASASDREAGRYTLYWEGTDDDGDGFYNEDGVGGVDLDRNFQHEYPYYQADAGPHMVSEPETRALIDFAVSHKNVGAILTFGHSDNLVTAPNGQGRLADASMPDLAAFADQANSGVLGTGVFSSNPDNARGGLQLRGAQPGSDNDPNSGRRPSVVVDAQDTPYFEAVSELYSELTGIESVAMNRTAQGAFFQFGYYQFGVPSFSTQGWALPEAEGEAALDATVEQLALASLGDGIFVPWTTVQHPDFESAEVGGFVPGALANPTGAAMSQANGEAHGDFIAGLAGMLPRLSIVDTEVTAHGGGVFTVSAVIENSGYFPTALRHGVVSRTVDATMVQIQVDVADIITGGAKSATTATLAGSGNRERFTWVIRGQSGGTVEIRARAQKGGTATATVTLR